MVTENCFGNRYYLRPGIALICCVCFLLSACSTFRPVNKNAVRSQVGYIRTKTIAVRGRITAQIDLPTISVCWDLTSYDSIVDNKPVQKADGQKLNEAVNDCFRSELIYKGMKDNEVWFEMKHYLCGRYESVGMEIVSIDISTESTFAFQGICITLLDTGPFEAVLQIAECK